MSVCLLSLHHNLHEIQDGGFQFLAPTALTSTPPARFLELSWTLGQPLLLHVL